MSDWQGGWGIPGNSAPTEWNDGNHGAGHDGFSGGAGMPTGWDNGAAENGGNDHGGGGRGGGCFNCGEDGHNKADCPNPRVMKCRHCDEVGHVIRDCPTAPPREFSGECHHCQKEGHMAKDCPDKPPEVCKNCQQEGHILTDCTNPRKIDRSHVNEVDAETAWTKMVQAARERDIDDLKEAVQEYVKACPDTTYAQLETAFRAQNIEVYLIAMENTAMLPSFTQMDLQGNLDKKYRVHYRFSAKPNRPRERELWPSSSEENLTRLNDAGEPVNRGLNKCRNCDQLGHIAKNCPEEKLEKERVTIMCYNCGETGHRIRDCPQERVDKFACKNCGQGGHKAAECPEPRKAGPDVECRKCGELGHFSKDCPQGGGNHGCYNCGQEGHSARDCTEPRKMICRNCDQEGHKANECPEPKNMSKVQCRNCDEFGHGSRECPKPRDYSRIQCQNCGQYGHTKVKCSNETVPPDDFGTGEVAEAPTAQAQAQTGDDGWGTTHAGDNVSNTAAGQDNGWGQPGGGSTDW